MTKTYCTACACYDIKWGGNINGAARNCTHPKGPGKLESPRTPTTCPLTIKYTLTPENSIVLRPQNQMFMPLVNPSMGSFDWMTEEEMNQYKEYRASRVLMND